MFIYKVNSNTAPDAFQQRQPSISTQQLYRNRTKNNSNQKQILESSTWDLSYGTPF